MYTFSVVFDAFLDLPSPRAKFEKVKDKTRVLKNYSCSVISIY